MTDRGSESDLPAGGAARAGTILAGKYRVDRVIGRGGMGLVVAATHLHLGEQVAIKLLLPGAPVRADAFERFLREGRAAARIRGEHVARVLDAGVLATGEPYLVLEYLRGVDLRTLLRERGPLSIDAALIYVLQICEAVAEAHALGIVHRDLKPGNVFLTLRADGSEAVKVIDFGISKITSPTAASPDDAPLTGSEAALGTPGYMAPEQMRSARAADVRADVWSLGALLHGLLTGASPFAGETMIAVYDEILKGAPSLRAARPDVPAALEAIVQRCLRFDRDARYDDVGQLAAALADLAPPAGRLSAERAGRIVRGVPPADALLDGARAFEGDADAAGNADAGSATIEVSFTLERATTAAAREPSWSTDRAPERHSAPPPASLAPPSITPAPAASPPRIAFDRRATPRLIAGALALAIAGVLAGYALRSRAITPAPARPIAAEPAAFAVATAALPAASIALPAISAPPALTTSPTVAVATTTLTVVPTVPHRAPTPRASAVAPVAPRSPGRDGLAATPD
jgi:serine/threonine-protein kinase